MVDADGMGRAFPELQMDTFTIYGVRPTPAALADPRGHEVVFDGIAEATTLERYARAVTIQMGGAAGYAFPPMTGAELKRTAIPGTITLAVAIGERRPRGPGRRSPIRWRRRSASPAGSASSGARWSMSSAGWSAGSPAAC